MKNNKNNRRAFITNTSKAAIAIGLSGSALNSFAVDFSQNTILNEVDFFLQKKLKYGFDAFKNVIDAQTMEIHYTKHAAGYCKNLNDAYLAEAKGKSLVEILSTISAYSTKMRNNAGGHYNHEMFWQCLTPFVNKTPDKVLVKEINETFGSFESFKTSFTDAAKTRFGSGWAWLIKTSDNKLEICSTANQDNPLMDISDCKGSPILCLDVWEHAYYLKYQNKRADYINNWWSIVNWDYVGTLYKNC